jgi:hypothetical protein
LPRSGQQTRYVPAVRRTGAGGTGFTAPLSFVEIVRDGVDGVQDLGVSPDGEHVYRRRTPPHAFPNALGKLLASRKSLASDRSVNQQQISIRSARALVIPVWTEA